MATFSLFNTSRKINPSSVFIRKVFVDLQYKVKVYKIVV